MSGKRFTYGAGPKGIKYQDEAWHCRSNPTKWVLVRQSSSPSGAQASMRKIKDGTYAAFRPAGQFDAYTEGTKVFARFVGQEAG